MIALTSFTVKAVYGPSNCYFLNNFACFVSGPYSSDMFIILQLGIT